MGVRACRPRIDGVAVPRDPGTEPRVDGLEQFDPAVERISQLRRPSDIGRHEIHIASYEPRTIRGPPDVRQESLQLPPRVTDRPTPEQMPSARKGQPGIVLRDAAHRSGRGVARAQRRGDAADLRARGGGIAHERRGHHVHRPRRSRRIIDPVRRTASNPRSQNRRSYARMPECQNRQLPNVVQS